MAYKSCEGRVDLEGTAIASVKSWSAEHSTAEIDTTVINNNCETSSIPGAKTYTLSLNVLVDPADASQNALVEGATDLEITIYPIKNVSGMPQRVYSGCSVNTFSDSGESGNPYAATIGISADSCVRSLVP